MCDLKKKIEAAEQKLRAIKEIRVSDPHSVDARPESECYNPLRIISNRRRLRPYVKQKKVNSEFVPIPEDIATNPELIQTGGKVECNCVYTIWILVSSYSSLSSFYHLILFIYNVMFGLLLFQLCFISCHSFRKI